MSHREAVSSRSIQRSSRRGWAGALAVVALLGLTACATPDQLPIGTTRAQVVERYGAPLAVHKLPDGAERLEYQIGPFQQYAQMVDVDVGGRVLRASQVRTAENFARIRIGVDTPATVVREFGTPWHTERYALSKLTAYLYPYKESNVFNLMMAVHFDDAGIVQRVESGPDPRFIGGRDRSH
jgi:outer membrane protein assembly factor BamE (lipoprotein component of BamABCDE complex)